MLGLTGIALPTRTWAGDPQAAEALYQSGKAALARGELEVACARLGESLRLEPAVGTALNLAECEQRSGKLASALAHYQEARDRLAPGDFRAAYVADRLAQLAPRVPALTVRLAAGAPPDAQVARDGTSLGPGALGAALPVDPGVHRIVVRAPEHAETSVEVTLAEGESRTVDVSAGTRRPGAGTAREATSAPSSSSPLSPASASSARDTWQTLGVVVGGAGALGLGAGAVMGLVARSTYDDARARCPDGPATCDAEGARGGERAYAQAAVATGLVVAGAVCLAGGAALWLAAPRAVSVTPAVGRGQAGLEVVGRW